MAEQQDLKDRIQASTLRQLVDSMNMRARKSLGQNFLLISLHTSRCSSGFYLAQQLKLAPDQVYLTCFLEGATHVIAMKRSARDVLKRINRCCR